MRNVDVYVYGTFERKTGSLSSCEEDEMKTGRGRQAESSVIPSQDLQDSCKRASVVLS